MGRHVRQRGSMTALQGFAEVGKTPYEHNLELRVRSAHPTRLTTRERIPGYGLKDHYECSLATLF